MLREERGLVSMLSLKDDIEMDFKRWKKNMTESDMVPNLPRRSIIESYRWLAGVVSPS